MEIVEFENIKEEIISIMRRNTLIPIIGSGFTNNCSSLRGQVPSGSAYKNYMIAEITRTDPALSTESAQLINEKFSSISSIYHEVVPPSRQEQYLRDHFTCVSIEKNKKDFLSLSWPYIYTLNIDDGIERNSKYRQIIYSNRKVNERVFDNEKCTIKLHGDVTEMLAYADSSCEVFSQEQYIASLKKNDKLLTKLRHDSIYQNLLFIGCSLDDEIDLLYSLIPSDAQGNRIARFICVTDKPSRFDVLKYQKYGITHCILFNSYNQIYSELYAAGIEAQQIRIDDLDTYNKFKINNLNSGFEANKPYLLFGKSLQEKNHTITIPYFFVQRKESAQIIDNFSSYNVQLLVGSRCCGKSYILADIARKIRDRNVYLFETKDRLTDQSFDALLGKKDCVILADSGVLTNNQFEKLLQSTLQLISNNINVVVSVNKTNRDYNSIIKLYEIEGKITSNHFPQVPVSSMLSKAETDQLNPLLTAIDAGLFSYQKTIVDNIISISRNLSEKNKYCQVTPRYETIPELSALITLCTEHKVYSSLASQLGLHEELLSQSRAASPLIDYEATWSFEKSNGDNSPMKYVLNAEYWLCEQLEHYAQNQCNHLKIVNAYKYIVSRLISCDGKPDILQGKKEPAYKAYILFDNINHIFSFNRSSGKKGLALIRIIYEGLNDMLSADPNYMHQRAKCYIKSSYYETETNAKLDYLEKAYRDANVSLQVFSQRYEECGNEKLAISRDHVMYTQALILCHKCHAQNYCDIEENSIAIRALSNALTSPYNDYGFAKNDTFNYNNVIEKMISTSISKRSLIRKDVYGYLENLFTIVRDDM